MGGKERKLAKWGFNGVARVYSFGNFARENVLRRFPQVDVRVLSYKCRNSEYLLTHLHRN